MAMKIFKAAQERGLRSRPLGNTLAFSPPICINEEEVDEIVKRLGAAMDGVSLTPPPTPPRRAGRGANIPFPILREVLRISNYEKRISTHSCFS
jgi:hypothetical protein